MYMYIYIYIYISCWENKRGPLTGKMLHASKHAAHRNQALCFADAKCTVPVCAADVRTLFALAM